MNTIEKEAIEQNKLNKLQHHLFGQPIKISLASSIKDIIGFLYTSIA